MIKYLLKGMLVLFCTYGYANTLMTDLDRLNTETLNAEFLAVNCIKSAQKDKLITEDCYEANRDVTIIDKELVGLIDYLTQDEQDLGTQFYVALSKIKQYRTRLKKVNNNLNIAKKVTGVYNWTDKVPPSYYQKH